MHHVDGDGISVCGAGGIGSGGGIRDGVLCCVSDGGGDETEEGERGDGGERAGGKEREVKGTRKVEFHFSEQ